MRTYVSVAVKSINDIVDLSAHLRLFVFRGQANSRWALETSLERAYIRSGRINYSLENTEHWMLHEFKNKFHLYSPAVLRTINTFEWLALMQHHGGATRLLDFTESIYVAAYFAALNASEDAAIWALNKPLLRDNLYQFAKLSYKKGHDLRDVINDYHIDLFNKSVARPHYNTAQSSLTHLVPLESQSLFDRASRQRSLFIGAGYLGSPSQPFSFMDNLKVSFPGIATELEQPNQVELTELCLRKHDDPCYKNFSVIKIVVPKNIHAQLRLEMRLMGLTEESLFPGIDGLSRSLVQNHIMC
ncbi:MAG: FRG domain-containing protein [Desulfocapsaceae bacterium]|nr:FRG domain-containing protein [Desulfocapsaceae bacterium]